jgi:hypothetical protein
MKSFVKKIVVYLFAVGVVALLVCIVYNCRKGTGSSETAKFQSVPNNINICNFGSSHGLHGYYYKDLEDEYTCFNFSLDSQSLSYDERILDCYQDRLARGGVVIIDISYFACYGKYETDYEEFKLKNQRYYTFLPAKYIKEYDILTDIKYNRLAALNSNPLEVLYAIMNIGGSTNISSYPEVTRTVDVSLLSEDTSAAAQRHIVDEKRDEKGELIYNEEEVQALCNMVNICREHDVTPILVTVPYLKEYKDALENVDSDFFENFYLWINGISEELRVGYYDYSDDERFSHDYGLFYNGDHMNSYGARKFTDILYDEVIGKLLK